MGEVGHTRGFAYTHRLGGEMEEADWVPFLRPMPGFGSDLIDVTL